MKKFLIIPVFLLTAFAAFSQTGSPTDPRDPIVTDLPANQVRNAIRAKDSLTIILAEVVLLRQSISFYSRFVGKDSLIIAANDKLDLANKNLIGNLRSQNTNLQSQVLTNEAINKDLLAVIKKKNGVIVKVAGVSVVVIGFLSYLLIR